MPRGDGTGPAGMGPMTGRGAGYCAGYGVPGYANPGPFGGFGGGRGHRHWFRATGIPGYMRFQGWAQPASQGVDPASEISVLQARARILQEQIDRINARLEELGGAAASEAKTGKGK